MSWLEISPSSDFSLLNLPFGVFSVDSTLPRCGVAIGDFVVDLYQLHSAGLLNGLPFDTSIFGDSTLNAFMGLQRPSWTATRNRLLELFSASANTLTATVDHRLRDNAGLKAVALIPLSKVKMHLPAKIGDYTDFYSSREHATNVGIMFRGVDNALQPNWLHLPVGYHGRASSVVLSGEPVVRPRGQLQANKDDPMQGSVYGECKLLDFELETGFFVGGGANTLGRPLTMAEAEDRIFGVVLLNDWSARDIQAWEYVPLGPFTAKNFCTSISPWVVTLDALSHFRCSSSAGEQQVQPTPLPYLIDPNYGKGTYDINLEVQIRPDGSQEAYTISRTKMSYMYWNMKQQLVHHSVTGCDMHAGDLLGSGTISGVTEGSLGSMLELSWRGSRDVKLVSANGTEVGIRKFLKDQDEVIIKGTTGVDPATGMRVGFGSVSGKILPAGSYDGKSVPETPAAPLPFHSFKLYSYYRSSSSWRVRIALALKKIPYEYIPVDLMKLAGNNVTKLPENIRDKNAMEQVPILEFVEAATDFLEEITSSVNVAHLLPKHDVVLRARVRQMAEIVNSGIAPLQNLEILRQVKAVEITASADSNGVFPSLDGRAFAKHNIQKGLLALEQLAKSYYDPELGAKFLGGSPVPTVADLCLIPQLYNARRFEVDLSAYPTLTAVAAACEGLPEFQASIPEAQPDFPKA